MLSQSTSVKLRIAVPRSHADKVRTALARSGAGKIGNYDSCSSSTAQIGRFRPLKGSHPAVGRQDEINEVEEELIESVCEKSEVARVLKEVKAVHPYEEPAIDILELLELS
jgi:hypothetical protein